MSQHSSLGWSDWEEDNLLPWLKKTRALSWDARAAAYRIMKNMGSSELWNRYEGKNTTFSANAVLIVRMHLHITHIQSAKDVFDDLEVPERDSQHSRIPRLKISTSDFRKYLQQNPPLRRTVPPQKSHIPVRRHSFIDYSCSFVLSFSLYETGSASSSVTRIPVQVLALGLCTPYLCSQ
jgi:hypothetical protein